MGYALIMLNIIGCLSIPIQVGIRHRKQKHQERKINHADTTIEYKYEQNRSN